MNNKNYTNLVQLTRYPFTFGTIIATIFGNLGCLGKNLCSKQLCQTATTFQRCGGGIGRNVALSAHENHYHFSQQHVHAYIIKKGRDHRIGS